MNITLLQEIIYMNKIVNIRIYTDLNKITIKEAIQYKRTKNTTTQNRFQKQQHE